MVANIVAWRLHWGPSPFILLNLALSFQAALATLIILMSQNWQGRLNDRRNNLKTQNSLDCCVFTASELASTSEMSAQDALARPAQLEAIAKQLAARAD